MGADDWEPGVSLVGQKEALLPESIFIAGLHSSSEGTG